MGNGHDHFGIKAGHENNRICRRYEKGPIVFDKGYEFPCQGELSGSIISIETEKRTGNAQLNICGLEYETY